MRIEIRDDVIDYSTHAELEFKYKKYLQHIFDAGGYVFKNQFVNMYVNGHRILNALEDLKLIKGNMFNNNYKYYYLTQKSLRYFAFIDDEEDYTDVKLNAKKISAKPSGKVLISSALKFDLIHNGVRAANKQLMVEDFETNYFLNKGVNVEEFDKIQGAERKLNDAFENTVELRKNIEQVVGQFEDINITQKYTDYKNFNNEIFTTYLNEYYRTTLTEIKNKLAILNERKNELEHIVEECRMDDIKSSLINYYEKSKLLFEFESSILRVIILDSGVSKTPWGHFILINKFIQSGLDVKYVDVQIVSYSETRAQSLRDDFEKSIEFRDKADEKMKEWERGKGRKNSYYLDRNHRDSWKYEPSDIYKRWEKVYYQFEKLRSVSVYAHSFYMESYVNNASLDDDYVKAEDRIDIEEIALMIKD